MEDDARRQMEIKARDAFFDSILSRKAIAQLLVLHVRRGCLEEDSLRTVSEVVGTGQDEIKKGLRIDSVGEEGLNFGGRRKECFLLLVREILLFDPRVGLFVYDDPSYHCYFTASIFETSDQHFFVGVLLVLAIHTSTILDVALTPVAFRKLLADARNPMRPKASSSRLVSESTLDDLAECRPTLAQGLRQLIANNGNIEEAFCCNFVIIVERYGHRITVSLCLDGDRRPVSNNNRQELVRLYVRYLLDSSVSHQYKPLKRGFYTVYSGDTLSLSRPKEIEVLIRGSDELLDVETLRGVAIYDSRGKYFDALNEPVLV